MFKIFQYVILLSSIIFLTVGCSKVSDNEFLNFITSNQAKSCEDPTIKNMVVEIFKENNPYYNSIDKSTISTISLLYPAVTEYDKSIDRYSCTGIIEMKSSNNGFKPREYDTNNSYYNYIYDIWNSLNTLKMYTTYKTKVTYYSQISEGQILVQATTNYSSDFSCEGFCEDIINPKRIEEQKIRFENEKKKDNEEHLNLPF
ncbi:hypothetical protein HDR58_00635 [bacterium]|nr:hypothetical protein [bacterium]